MTGLIKRLFFGSAGGVEQPQPEKYVPSALVGHDGISMNVSEQLATLKNWNSRYKEIFKLLREDPQINTHCLGENYLHNGYYPTPDAEIYAAFILDYRPSHIIEVGGGFSTLIASKVAGKLQNDCKITVIDPNPRTQIGALASRAVQKPVEDVPISEMSLDEKTLMFIDSSHIVRPKGDVAYLYTQIIPNLPSGTLVHVHDIFIPYDYPPLYQSWSYSEQYLLHALLSDSPRYKVLLSTHWLAREQSKIMQEVFGSVVGRDSNITGLRSGFW